MTVPFLDLQAHHLPLQKELEEAIAEVIAEAAFAGGPYVAAFEKEFAPFCGVREAVGVGNGTEALLLALHASGVGHGDEVITVPATFIATAEAIWHAGARPVFVDIDNATQTLDPALLEAAITPRTKAVVPVHLFGQPADMDPILEVARRHGLTVIEDACQAHGAEYHGRRAGSLADAGCFSFYPGKNLGAFGDAGALVTDDAALAEKVRMLREHGQTRKYHHAMMGWNCRMDGIQAAVLRVKLRHLERANARRRENAALYNSLLAGVEEIALPVEADYARHVYHVYAIRAARRDELFHTLTQSGIGCGIHYPVPLHLQPACRYLGYQEGDFPVSEQAALEVISLPMYPELTPEQIHTVAEKVKDAVCAGLPG